MVNELVFATNNSHKLDEVRAKIGGNYNILSLDAIGCYDDIEETGQTFNDNASIKSNFIYNKYHVNCFGDDSGLEVDALNGEPGVYSARYAGTHGDHDANISKLLSGLSAKQNRQARFKTVISLIWKGSEYLFEGVVEGIIRPVPSGSKGFGYDPVFEPDGYTTTFAEMSMEQKNAISHRARAVAQMVEFLKQAV